MNLNTLKVKKIDRYIMGKFLGTYLLTISLLIVIVVIFDLTEKIEDFLELHAPAKAIALDYYKNFIPFFMNQFSGLITFISVILFTSKMAYQTEIIAILSGGVSFNRFLYPYLLSALLITIFSLTLNLFIIPQANVTRMEFEMKYLKKNLRNQYDDYIYRQVSPGTYVQIRGYNKREKRADFLVISTYENNQLKSQLSAERVDFDPDKKSWKADRYIQRSFDEQQNEVFKKAQSLDTIINLTSDELGKPENYVAVLDNIELRRFIKEQEMKGSENLSLYKAEMQNRFAYPLSTLVLTLIGVSLSSRKVRGGTGLHMSIGITLCFSYILFMKFANEFAKSNTVNPEISVWIPNLLFLGIAVYLYLKAPK